MRHFTGSTNHSDRATRGINKGRIMVNIKENHREPEECVRLNQADIARGIPPRYDMERAKHNIELVRPSELSIEGCYQDVFGESIKRFNKQQRRKDRHQSIEKMLSKIYNSKKNEEPMQSMIVQVGNAESQPEQELCQKILLDYYNKFQEKFPNLYVVSACIHLDESTPHLQMYYIPIKYKNKASEEEQKKWRGTDMQESMSGALRQMGYTDNAMLHVPELDKQTGEVLHDEDGQIKMIEKHDFKNCAMTQFQKDFNGLLDEICVNYDIIIDHPLANKKATRKDTIEYYQNKERMTAEIEHLRTAIIDLQNDNENLQIERNSLEHQVRRFKDTMQRIQKRFQELVESANKRLWKHPTNELKAREIIDRTTPHKRVVTGYLEDDLYTQQFPIDELEIVLDGSIKLSGCIENDIGYDDEAEYEF